MPPEEAGVDCCGMKLLPVNPAYFGNDALFSSWLELQSNKRSVTIVKKNLTIKYRYLLYLKLNYSSESKLHNHAINFSTISVNGSSVL